MDVDATSQGLQPLTLVLGSKNYSSWSMRAWLLLRWLGIPFEEITLPLYQPNSRDALFRYSPAGKVPVLLDGDLGIWDSLAIVEHIAETHPQVWPRDRRIRAYARSICAEMHAGFTSMRSNMPFNASARGRQADWTDELRADVDRIQEIWSQSRERFGADGPWLLGEFGIADIMFAPPAVRFVTYGVQVDVAVREYHRDILAHPLVAEWLALGLTDEIIPACELGA